MTSRKKNAVPVGALDHLDIKKKRKWDIEYNDQYGRYIVAKEDIGEGEVLFVDYPIVTGPKQDCSMVCLGCYRQLDVYEHTYRCSKCGWWVCDADCENRGYHPLECQVFSKSSYTPDINTLVEDRPIYESILPLRCFMLKKNDVKKWKTLSEMESHDDLRRGNDLWKEEQVNVCDFLIRKIGLDADDATLHTINGILDVNCHEVRSNIPGTQLEYRVRGIYPLCAMMSHDCSSNTHHSVMEDMTMVVVASRQIPKGHQATGTYTHLLSATTERRKHLRYGKFFDCICERCSDPTELGTYFGGLKCSQAGCGGIVMSTNPVDPTNDAPWACKKCNFQVKAQIVERLNKMVYYELRNATPNDPMELEMIFKKYSNILHDNHFHLVGIRHSLSQMYGRVEGYLLNEMTDSQMTRKEECCRQLLSTIGVIDPGISRLRGLTMYELHAPILLRTNRAFQSRAIPKSEMIQKLEEVEKLLEGTLNCLQFEPQSSFEGQINKIAKGSLSELKKWIVTVKDLPPETFAPEEEDVEEGTGCEEENVTLEGLLKKLEGSHS
ncbi:SET domain-containing protein SmydA-8-like isoform X2 [Oratosquilla oratoria]|uniref:SET domain-containing protein SmydA-8-like isoform X2 n=1 Tax=Oratosquilla oratoria TaxID=337810 RepID=UPI003F760C59